MSELVNKFVGQSGFFVRYRVKTDHTLLKIAELLIDIPYDEMTTTEKEILNVLFRSDIVAKEPVT